ncbi:SMC-Scp complex subunit ScpB [Methylocaldum sp.]|uniref:SMC-Scp complex subunit ScpB n=1 Tax=Methylocaldum sp. TaxID=1969727 RepID=UPI002D61DCE5|nr:SMC-Scp complex subunit ScpB [Methylocaldum sp.]HYE34228.1 SMC-Scp complex subunit ScpB [Methylocaldum sp.]
MELKTIIEAALLSAARPLSIAELENLFAEGERPEPAELQAALAELAEDCRSRSVELKQVASGYRLQVRESFSPWISRLFEERPGRYSRAFLETLAIIAYRQPVTRGEIEDIRGVAVSTGIVRTLQERGWIQVVGHKEVPGRPALLATTKQFLDYFSLKSLGELPPLQEFIDDLALQAAPQDNLVTEHANTESIE